MSLLQIIALIILIGWIIHYVFIRRYSEDVETVWSVRTSLILGPPTAKWYYKLAHITAVILFIAAFLAFDKDKISGKLFAVSVILPFFTFMLAAWFANKK